MTPVTAEDILSAMAGAYARCRSYRDAGVLAMHVFPETRPAYTNEKRFGTAFLRPDRFRFEYHDCFFPGTPETRHVAWASGNDVRDWTDWRDGKTEHRYWPSLREVLTALGGVSGRLSVTVPSLLVPGWADGKRWNLCELARLDDDRIGEIDCYRVRGRFSAKPGHDEACRKAVRETLGEETWDPRIDPTTFWIEKERLLLRRFSDSARVTNFRFEVVADYTPEIDVPLSDAELAFGVG